MALETWRENRAERRELRRHLADAYLQQQLDLVQLGALTLTDKPGLVAEAPAAGGDPQVVAVDEQELDDATRTRVKQIRTEYAVIAQITRARITGLDEEAEEISQELEQRSQVNAELQARQEELKRQAQVVDQMGAKLALWNVELAADSRVTRLQPAVIDRRAGD
jgi:hypothetical protein